ncbi:MAG: hypothetical protein COW73_08425 [Nitrospirae bacterium CG18_big_fil_WC_8_21_14_2_50_70_55]|nr:hypothetical protein [Deltaproteobacteria bacterium]OIP61905.1 MAG: hypothetical protein AUK30_11250 [Nitrospirae bacterium CG2_30_70_394]PIQ04142.1 MAG: hypothetical protein COW73_08425 [Nitrospirae bacterium CG18_big_fil_WC_8_21_14_2_50_70_55]PIU79748.1 MAG: hypothetical protein COS73_02435 [Nitrospirae bacterium CG06_land_8_20_14_3_00_70_43]PIW82409.1 MAG: hypothetical protein COZ96_08900 [Nitrospirae bacterium CG_4_8_14_3_um_filter_70_85]PIX82586.1 MAG: hypothetical protein COZ33_09870 
MSHLDPGGQRSLTASDLASRSGHCLHGHLHTILGFAELLAEDGEESGPLLLESALRLRVRIDALLHLHDRCHRGWNGRGAPAAAILDELVLPTGLAIDNRLPPHTHLHLDPRGLRVLLAELGVLAAPSLVVLTGDKPAVEITTTLATELLDDGDGAVSVAIVQALVADLGGSLSFTDVASGRRRLTVGFPHPRETAA